MSGRFSRTETLFGKENMQKLANSKVAIFGIGGVGGYALEGLLRSGVGSFDLIDGDEVDITNLNRQIIATQQTVGRKKAEVAKERILSVNPQAKVTVFPLFFSPENADEFDFSCYDYVVDAVDTVSAKIAIVERAQKAGVPVISSMGTGNKTDPTAFKVADVFQTSVDPLAKILRAELKKRGIKHLKVVYSEEKPILLSSPPLQNGDKPFQKTTVGSNAFTPSAAGLIIASEVVKDLTSFHPRRKGNG